MGWKVIVIWECELEKNFSQTMEAVETELQRQGVSK